MAAMGMYRSSVCGRIIAVVYPNRRRWGPSAQTKNAAPMAVHQRTDRSAQ